MDKVKEILAEMTDYELSVFNQKKLTRYSKEMRRFISRYTEMQRGLSSLKQSELINRKPAIDPEHEDKFCPECHSSKRYTYSVEWDIPINKMGYEDEMARWKLWTTGEITYKDKIECFVCGEVLVDPNNRKRSFKQKLLDYFFDNPIT